MRAMLGFSLRQALGRRRLILLVALAALPVVVSGIVASVSSEEDFVAGLIDVMLISAILPIVTMAIATAAFGNELEDRTLGYLVLKPMARWRLVLPKLLASVIAAGPLIVAAGVGIVLLGSDGGVRTILAVIVALAVAVIVYASIFTWAGLMTTRALGFALVYVVLWEGVVGSFLPGIRYLSVRGYAVGTLAGLDGEGFEAISDGAIGLTAALVGAVIVAAAFFWLSVWRLRRMDVP